MSRIRSEIQRAVWKMDLTKGDVQSNSSDGEASPLDTQLKVPSAIKMSTQTLGGRLASSRKARNASRRGWSRGGLLGVANVAAKRRVSAKSDETALTKESAATKGGSRIAPTVTGFMVKSRLHNQSRRSLNVSASGVPVQSLAVVKDMMASLRQIEREKDFLTQKGLIDVGELGENERPAQPKAFAHMTKDERRAAMLAFIKKDRTTQDAFLDHAASDDHHLTNISPAGGSHSPGAGDLGSPADFILSADTSPLHPVDFATSISGDIGAAAPVTPDTATLKSFRGRPTALPRPAAEGAISRRDVLAKVAKGVETMDHPPPSKGAEAMRKKKQKEREQRELMRRRAQLRTENASLRERVDKIAAVGEEHRMKVEEMFVQRQHKQEALQDELQKVKDDTLLLRKEAAESEAQLHVSRVAKRDLEASLDETEQLILSCTKELSRVVAELGVRTALVRRLDITSATKRDDLRDRDTAVVRLETELVDEQRLCEKDMRQLARSAEALDAAQTRHTLLEESVASAKAITATSTAALNQLLASLAAAEIDAKTSRADVMPILLKPDSPPPAPPTPPHPVNPPPSVLGAGSVSPTERREKAEAYQRAQAVKRELQAQLMADPLPRGQPIPEPDLLAPPISSARYPSP